MRRIVAIHLLCFLLSCRYKGESSQKVKLHFTIWADDDVIHGLAVWPTGGTDGQPLLNHGPVRLLAHEMTRVWRHSRRNSHWIWFVVEICRREIRSIRTDCGDERCIERILGETEQDAGLPHPRIADQEQLKQIIIRLSHSVMHYATLLLLFACSIVKLSIIAMLSINVVKLLTFEFNWLFCGVGYPSV